MSFAMLSVLHIYHCNDRALRLWRSWYNVYVLFQNHKTKEFIALLVFQIYTSVSHKPLVYAHVKTFCMSNVFTPTLQHHSYTYTPIIRFLLFVIWSVELARKIARIKILITDCSTDTSKTLIRQFVKPGARLTKAYDVTIQRYRNSHAKIEDSKMHILPCMGSKFCVKFQRCPLKFHTKFGTHTTQNMHFTRC